MTNRLTGDIQGDVLDVNSDRQATTPDGRCLTGSVLTMSTHALFHLSDQVRKMGPLTVTSTSTFENLNRVLKLSVSGTKGQVKWFIFVLNCPPCRIPLMDMCRIFCDKNASIMLALPPAKDASIVLVNLC